MKKSLKALVEKNKDLFWDCKRDRLSNEAIVERFLNYAELDDIKEMIKILGYDNVKAIFKKQIIQTRLNYNPLSANIFLLSFNLRDEVPYRDIIQRAERNVRFH